jgi:hypothetical protein
MSDNSKRCANWLTRYFRPIVSYSAFDEVSYFVDLTPFVGALADGSPHNFTLNVVSAERNHSIDANWYVTAAIHVVTGPSSKRTKGKITKYDVSPYASTKTTGHVHGTDLEVTIQAERQLRIEAEITDGEGKTTNVVWSQDLAFTNTLCYLNNASIEVRRTSLTVKDVYLLRQTIIRMLYRHPRAHRSLLTMALPPCQKRSHTL